jgi:hypothetical protein
VLGKLADKDMVMFYMLLASYELLADTGRSQPPDKEGRVPADRLRGRGLRQWNLDFGDIHVLAHGSRVKSEKLLGRIAQWQEDVGHDTMELVELKLVLQILATICENSMDIELKCVELEYVDVMERALQDAHPLQGEASRAAGVGVLQLSAGSLCVLPAGPRIRAREVAGPGHRQEVQRAGDGRQDARPAARVRQGAVPGGDEAAGARLSGGAQGSQASLLHQVRDKPQLRRRLILRPGLTERVSVSDWSGAG